MATLIAPLSHPRPLSYKPLSNSGFGLVSALAKRASYEVIFIPMTDCQASGEYDDFLTGFATKDGGVWGRPVGVAVGNDGSRSIWRVTWVGK